uniref:SJCHGC03073 protein n=1 Tax=Schistosoma japonicum TaxID=6182 RepID=Q5BSX9_SCHJA|nr:SJCHGC03073 protein [Schistosoma japonicum]
MVKDVGCSVSELVYGTTLQLPGEFVETASTSANLDLNSYVNRLTNAMCSVKPVQIQQQSTNTFI